MNRCIRVALPLLLIGPDTFLRDRVHLFQGAICSKHLVETGADVVFVGWHVVAHEKGEYAAEPDSLFITIERAGRLYFHTPVLNTPGV